MFRTRVDADDSVPWKPQKNSSHGAPPASAIADGRRANRPLHRVAGTVLVLVLSSWRLSARALWTDRPQFCGTCHEMRPYVTAWAQGPHRGVWCVDCHVGKSYPARMAHKFAALQEVVAHFSGTTEFPRRDPTEHSRSGLPACHTTVTPRSPHPASTTRVTSARRRARRAMRTPGTTARGPRSRMAGPFNTSGHARRSTGAIATIDHGSANVPGHVTVLCTRCHDLKQTGCPACHTPPAGHFKPASRHAPLLQPVPRAGTKWTFAHPDRTDCQTCHSHRRSTSSRERQAPARCWTCHKQPGNSWAFSHPARRSTAPAATRCPRSTSPRPQHRSSPARSVTFSRVSRGRSPTRAPAPTARAATRRRRITRSGQCSQCHHQTGVSFAFSHPAARTAWHPRPSVQRMPPQRLYAASCTCHVEGRRLAECGPTDR